jgi:hypothetical protein
VVLEKDGDDQLDRSCEKRSILERAKKEKNILHAIHWRKTKWICHILRRNCVLKHVIEVKIEGKIGT